MNSLERCEWDPVNQQPATPTSGCLKVATWSVGGCHGNWHLCDDCAALKVFARKRRRVPLPLRTPPSMSEAKS